MKLMNHLLPEWQFAERHALQLDDITTAQAYASIVPGLSAEDPWVQRAIAVREMPGRLLRSLGLSRNTLPPQAFGFHSFTCLGQAPDREVVFGLAGQFWRLDYGLRPVTDAAAFTHMSDQPRLLLNVCVEPVSAQGCRLVTHTRVHCATEAQRRRFAPYWYAIRPVSGLIRQRLLQRIAKMARATAA
ncbi:DUF2867 domain-containing protein [Hydrogenophaga sp. SL48]|uniref:DUF2867 domain-containing protein n=1 Tax=Hydrogenophaga sp. SL48 TaxID=2806347 RepID=UPI001F3D573F|nr:DUF2867 domain-containing protein [Hydrogenophaga sp. SL48]UJW81674.1 DUF2867 domain-containing protein [Hydrogenophaga sp. SL48]